MARCAFLAALAIACALVATASTKADLNDARDSAETRLRATLDAVEKAVAYMGRHSGAANLDGGIGVRSVEGQFGALLARHWTQLPVWAVTRIRAIQNLAARVAVATRESVRRSTPEYYANAGQLVAEHSWDAFFPSRRLPLNSVAELLKDAAEASDEGGDNFDEKFSDDCIHEFYGLHGRLPCSISNHCWNTMVLSEGRKDYFLTHQLFYLLSGINANCLYNLTAMARSSRGIAAAGSESHHPLRGLFDKFCSRILVAATLQERRGFPVWDRDLFMEQVGLCGLAGYMEFAQARWRSHVIGWQRANGCYGVFPGEEVAPENFNPTRYGNFKRRRRSGISKRSEALMSVSGCLSHRTSVAMDALGTFVRAEVEAVANGGV